MFKASNEKQKTVLEGIFGERKSNLLSDVEGNKFYKANHKPGIFVYKQDNENCFVFRILDGELFISDSEPFGGVNTYSSDYTVTPIGSKINLKEYV